MNRYERINIKNLIDGYMVGSPSRPLESHTDQFERAKSELIKNMERQIDLIKKFGIEDFKAKSS